MTTRDLEFLVGVDIGGTFTDFVIARRDGEADVLKVPTNKERPEEAVFKGLARAAEKHRLSLDKLVSDVRVFVHGTTIATNAVIERNGPKVGLICNRGFRDVLVFRDGFKPDRYNLRMPPPDPFLPRHLRIGVGGRIDHRGIEIEPLDETSVLEAIDKLRYENVEAVAIALLWSIQNDAHERAVAEIVQRELPGLPITISSAVMPILDEWKRTSATVLSAYVKRQITSYLRRLEGALHERGLTYPLLVMQVNGGGATVDEIEKAPIFALHSGPAAAPAAGMLVCRQSGIEDAIVVDMGGTSFDVALLSKGQPSSTADLRVDDMPVGVQALKIESIGAGGGSMAWIDSGGALRVGPHSAGANPGPACYARSGTLPTVTDADLVLGYLHESNPLGGNLYLQRQLAEDAVWKHVAVPFGMPLEAAAHAIFTVVNDNMVQTMRLMSVKQGLDPRDYVLIVGGGAGPVHGAKLAQMLGIERVIVPRDAGTFCAMGMIAADVRHDYVRAAELRSSDSDFVSRLCRTFESLEQEAIAALSDEGFEKVDISFIRTIDARYTNQFHDIVVELPGGVLSHEDLHLIHEAFHVRHERLYTYAVRELPIDVFHCRLAAFGRVTGYSPARQTPTASEPVSALKGSRSAFFEESGGYVETAVYDGDRLQHGMDLMGPAIVERATTTVVVLPGQSLTIDAFGSYEIATGDSRSAGTHPRASMGGRA